MIDKSQGNLDSINSNYFPLCPPLSTSIARLFFKVHLNFLRTHSAAPITSYRLFSNLRCARSMIHPGNCSLAPSPGGVNRPIISQSLLEFSCSKFKFIPNIALHHRPCRALQDWSNENDKPSGRSDATTLFSQDPPPKKKTRCQSLVLQIACAKVGLDMGLSIGEGLELRSVNHSP